MLTGFTVTCLCESAIHAGVDTVAAMPPPEATLALKHHPAVTLPSTTLVHRATSACLRWLSSPPRRLQQLEHPACLYHVTQPLQRPPLQTMYPRLLPDPPTRRLGWAHLAPLVTG